MAYANPYANSAYQQYMNPYQTDSYPQYPGMGGNQMRTLPQPSYNGRIMVQGEEGVRNYLVAPNTTVDLWDTQQPVIYQKTADANGVASVRVIDYAYRDKPADTGDYATRQEFKNLENKVDQLIAVLTAPQQPRNGGNVNEQNASARQSAGIPE